MDFIGRSGSLLLFTQGDSGVVINSDFNLVVDSAKSDTLKSAHVWESGDFSQENEELAAASLQSLDTAIVASAGRRYTIPKGAQNEAKKALKLQKEYGGGTPVGRSVANMLAAGGQVNMGQLRHIDTYFTRHAPIRESALFNSENLLPEHISWGLWGGDAARRWANTIIERENQSLIAAGLPIETDQTTPVDDFRDAYELDPNQGPEFLARVRLDGSGLDRLYKIDFDGQVYVWDDGQWDDLGNVDGDVYTYDKSLDDPYDTVEKSHIVIDPDSAVILGSQLHQNPDTPVSVEDIDPEESRIAADALDSVDWQPIDYTLTAAAPAPTTPDGTPGQYTPQERAQNAQKQVRDSSGKFAKVGSRVMVGGDPSKTGNITRVNPADGTVTIAMANGQPVTVPGNSVSGVGQYTATVPGQPVDVPPVDFSGILAEPRTPINRVGAQLPGTLPAMTTQDLHNLISDFPAWVKSQRDAFKSSPEGPAPVHVQGKNRLDLGKGGSDYLKKNHMPFTKNAYDHPLLKNWITKTNPANGIKNSAWYNPLTAAGQPMAPGQSDVQPIYLAEVAPEDPRAVLNLVSLVPESSESTAPMTYVRKDGKWTRDPQIINDLKSATPPPVVPLDSDTLNDVLKQVDQSMGADENNKNPAPADSPANGEAAPAPVAAQTPTPAVAASGQISLDEALMVLWGPRKAIIAAGGLDRNRGQAEKLRRYWVHGEGAAKIRWGEKGDWKRCVMHLGKFMGERAKGYCQLRHKEATGIYTATHAKRDSKSHAIDGIEFATLTEITPEDMSTPVLEIISQGVDDPGFDSEFTPPREIIDAISNEYGDVQETQEGMLEDAGLPWDARDDYGLTAAGGLDQNRGQAEKLRHYWTVGMGGAKIRWNSGGDWTRCVRHLEKYLGPRAKGYCALRHKEMTGMWTGDKRHIQVYGREHHAARFSNEFVASTDKVIEQAVLNAKANEVRERMGLTADGAPQVGARFSMPLVMPEGIESGDGRTIKEGAISMRDFPLPLLWQIKSGSGHDGSVIVGRIDHMERIDGGIGNAHGVFDTGVYGREAERLVREGFLRGISADMDQFEAQSVDPEEEDTADEAADAEDAIKQEKMLVSKARIMAVTLVPKPAFQECRILLADDEQDSPQTMLENPFDGDELDIPSLAASGFLASAIPVDPPMSWFENPKLDKPTPLTLTEEGRVYGHIASWGSDHIGFSAGTRPPRSKSNYAYFHTGVIRTHEGRDVSVGQLTLAGGHASMDASAAAAVKHYDDTASAIADVHAGEDAYGIWVAGSLRPDATPAQIRAFRASAPSGDWRPINNKLELVAVCQVNVPGFPIARAFVASGSKEVYALVAAGAAPLVQLKMEQMQAELQEAEQFVARAELDLQAAAIRNKFHEVAGTMSNADNDLTRRASEISKQFSEMADFKVVSPKKREALAKKGHALPDGSYPIENEGDLKRAIRAYGRAKESDRAKVRRHIIKRARALGKSDVIPSDWKSASTDEISAHIEHMKAVIAAASAVDSGVDLARKIQEANPKALTPELREQIKAIGTEEVSTPQQNPGDIAPKPNGVGGFDTPDSLQKYTPKTQPRDEQGQFRQILARLRDNLGVSGNQEVVEQIKQTENLDNAGNYQAAVQSSHDLIDTVDRMDSGALNATSIENVRLATTDLAKTIANLPLPFANQAQKVRFSDLPPALRELTQQMIDRVNKKIGTVEGAKATADLRSFMSGADVYSQSEINSQLNRMLRLIT